MWDTVALDRNGSPKSFDMHQPNSITLSVDSTFIFSTSGSASSILKYNAMLQHFGLDVVYMSFAHSITAKTYAGLLRAPIVRGGAVTGQGLKTDIIPFLDEIDEYAKELGSVNTVINRAGSLFGYNTDAFGFERAIRNHLALGRAPLRSAVVYGNGGVSGVAYKILSQLGIQTTMRGRDQEKVRAKLAQLGAVDFSGPYDLVVNATPVSSKPLREAVGLEELLEGAKVVFDHNMPERDGQTNYLAENCSAQQISFIAGKEMHHPQMIKQWSLFLAGQVSEEDLERYCSC